MTPVRVQDAVAVRIDETRERWGEARADTYIRGLFEALGLLLYPEHQQIARQSRDIAHDCRHDDDATCGDPDHAFDSSESVVKLIDSIVDAIKPPIDPIELPVDATKPIIDLLKSLLIPSGRGFRRRYGIRRLGFRSLVRVGA